MQAGRFAERVVEGRDDTGRDERVVIWIERRPGALWAVGRMVNPQHRETGEARADDYVWEGHELEDCLQIANATLESVKVDGDNTVAESLETNNLLAIAITVKGN